MEYLIFGYIASFVGCMTMFLLVRSAVNEYITEAVEAGDITKDGTGALNKVAFGYICAAICPLLNTVTLVISLVLFERQNERLYEIVDEAWGIED